ncbi:MAG: hypothetical protein K2Y14_05845 [Burkholderiales bacterium]|nr:hypothetical protein [Burkholderiales bacterium]
MAKLKIKNFGPIGDGLTENDGWIEFKKVTLFIGNQATGKSSIVKLYSSFIWLEKRLLRGYITAEDILSPEFNFRNVLNFHNMASYLQVNTLIEYISEYYKIVYSNGRIKQIEKYNKEDEAFDVFTAKVLYIPAERNFLTAIENSKNFNELPTSLMTFQSYYREALKEIAVEEVSFPINDIKIKYNVKGDETYIIQHSDTDHVDIKIHESSSGIQSSVPLYLTTLDQTNQVHNNCNNLKEINLEYFSNDKKNFTQAAFEVLQHNIERRKSKELSELNKNLNDLGEIDTYLDNLLEDLMEPNENKQDKKDKVLNLINELDLLKTKMKSISSEGINLIEASETLRFYNVSLVNIVEELEQNLYPISQQILLYELIKLTNKISTDVFSKVERSKLIITSHSPYLISYLNLLIQGKSLLKICENTNKSDDVKIKVSNAINKLVNIDALLDGEDVAVYYCGQCLVNKVEKLDALITDDNGLNNLLEDSNSKFIKMLELEEYLKHAKSN